MKLPHILLAVFLLFLFVACGNPVQETNVLLTNTPLITVIPSGTPFPTLPMALTFTVAPTKTITLTPTLNPTQQIWVSTSIAVRETKQVVDEQAREETNKEIDLFPKVCADSYNFDLSPDANWLATSCGDKTYSILVVQNKEGTKWVLDYKDFLHPSLSSEGVTGGLGVVFWGPEGEYLYFTASVGWSGGGDFCFPKSGGTLGLFRLNLKTGSWTTLIDRTDRFPGDKIRFASTGRRYAVDINGITITDLQTGEVIQINVGGIMELIWSPDGTKLAYSTSRCNEEGFVIDSSLYVWDALENESQLILKAEKALLYPDSWDDISRLDISSEQYMPEINNTTYALYEYDITHDKLIFIGPYSILP